MYSSLSESWEKVPALIGIEQPPSAEVIANRQRPDHCEKYRDKRQVICHTRQRQPDPLKRISPLIPGEGAPLSSQERGWG